MATASSHNRLTSATRSEWTSPRSRAGGRAGGAATVMLDLLDVLERLRAGAAAVERSAGGRAEVGDQPGIGRSAVRAVHVPAGQAQRERDRAAVPVVGGLAGRGDAGRGQLAAAR